MFPIIFYVPHAKRRMAQRGICLNQIQNVSNVEENISVKQLYISSGKKELRYFRRTNPKLEILQEIPKIFVNPSKW